MRESLEVNLRLKKLEADARQHQREVEALLQELGGRDLDQLRRNLEAERNRCLEVQKQRSFRQGELAQTQAAVQALDVEIKSPLYNGVEERHREAVIQHESAAYASRDLGRYHSALDK